MIRTASTPIVLALAFIALLASACGKRPDPAARPAADDVTEPAGSTAVLIEGARVFDGNGDVGIVSILVRDGRIESIAETIDAPDGAQRMDYAGRFVIPGLVSDHSHLANTDGIEHGDRFFSRDNVVRDLRRFQAFGVTTVTALGMNGSAASGIRDEVNADPVLGASMLTAGAGIGVDEGAPPVANMGLELDPVARPGTAEAARAAVRSQAEAGVDLIKLWVDDLGGKAPQMAPEVYRAAIEEARSRGLLVAAHIHDLDAARALVEAGVDVIAHGVRDRAVDDALIEAMKARGTWYIPTLQIDEANYLYAQEPELLDTPFLRAALPAAVRARFADPAWRDRQLSSEATARAKAAVATNLRNLRALHEAGVRIGFGTDSGALPHRVIGFAEHRELELMTSAGFTPGQALSTATRDAAALLRLDDRGVLAPGKRADFVVLDADPLTDIRNTRGIVAVWQAGRQVAGPITGFHAD